MLSIKYSILDLLLLLPDVIQAKGSKKNDVIVRLKVNLQNCFVQLDANCFLLIRLVVAVADVSAAADATDAVTDAVVDAVADAADACNLEAL